MDWHLGEDQNCSPEDGSKMLHFMEGIFETWKGDASIRVTYPIFDSYRQYRVGLEILKDRINQWQP